MHTYLCSAHVDLKLLCVCLHDCVPDSRQLRVQYEEYPAGAAQHSRLALLIQDVEVRDCLSVSAINKLLYQYCSEDIPRQTHANMVSCLCDVR